MNANNSVAAHYTSHTRTEHASSNLNDTNSVQKKKKTIHLRNFERPIHLNTKMSTAIFRSRILLLLVQMHRKMMQLKANVRMSWHYCFAMIEKNRTRTQIVCIFLWVEGWIHQVEFMRISIASSQRSTSKLDTIWYWHATWLLTPPGKFVPHFISLISDEVENEKWTREGFKIHDSHWSLRWPKGFASIYVSKHLAFQILHFAHASCSLIHQHQLEYGAVSIGANVTPFINSHIYVYCFCLFSSFVISHKAAYPAKQTWVWQLIFLMRWSCKKCNLCDKYLHNICPNVVIDRKGY